MYFTGCRQATLDDDAHRATTLRWREVDSNHRYLEDEQPLRDGFLSPPASITVLVSERDPLLSRREPTSPSSRESCKLHFMSPALQSLAQHRIRPLGAKLPAWW